MNRFVHGWPGRQPEATDLHVFVEGPLHGYTRTTAELNTLMPWLEQYALTTERVTGSVSQKRARVWRPARRE